jgi:hypothetical protein
MSTRRMKLYRPRPLAIAALAAAVVGYLAIIPPASVVKAQSGAPLVQAHQMVYEGSFRFPDPQGAAPNGWNGGGALAMSPDGQGLFGSGEGGFIAELQIPAIQQSATVAGFATATYRQPFTQIWDASRQGLGCGTGGELGGILPWAGSLITTRYCFYDATYVQTRSHFRSSLQLGPTTGPFMVQSPTGTGGGSAGFVSGYMATIPAEWRALFGGPALTGNCCLSIITRTSWGPAASVFNPAQVGVVDPVPATAVVGYPTGTPLDGGADCSATSVLFNCNTAVRGLAFPSGTSSVLFFGTQGTGESCYGRGTSDPALHRRPDPTSPGDQLCYDPAGGSKGNHAFPYRFQVWAYNANDLVRVKNGQLAPHQVRPYAVWALDYPLPHISRNIGGVAYDPATSRLYVSAWAADGTDGYKPLMHIFRINAGTPAPPQRRTEGQTTGRAVPRQRQALQQAAAGSSPPTAQFEYVGAFRLPGPDAGDLSFSGGGGSMAFVDATQTLLIQGTRGAPLSYIADVTIPEPRRSTDLAGLITAAFRQPFTDVLRGKQRDIGCGGPIGGLLPWAGALVVSVYCYYDAAYIEVNSHYRTGVNFGSLPSVVGPVEIKTDFDGGGRAGFVSGYMTPIPPEWQNALGGLALTGNCCIPIITRTSWGPAAYAFDPGQIGVRSPVPAVPLVRYTAEHPTLGRCESDGTEPGNRFNCTTEVVGVVFPRGSSSVLFIGSHGTGRHCYGNNTPDPSKHLTPDPTSPRDVLCYDPGRSGKGPHAYPYVNQIWAYSAADLASVRQGTKQPWQVEPYATWGFDLPFQGLDRSILGAAYDAATGRLFLSTNGDIHKPLIHVLRLRTN